MRVVNVHERLLAASPSQLGALLNSLASENDRLWPKDLWPAMWFDRPLSVGASGGHGPARYTVSEYEPGRLVRFRFRRPRGFDGEHRYEVLLTNEGAILRHVIEMRARGRGLLNWLLFARPIHDALVEDCLDRAERELTGAVVSSARWSPWVRFLRRVYVLSRRRRRGSRRRERSR